MNKNNRLIHAYVGLVNVMDSNMGTIMKALQLNVL